MHKEEPIHQQQRQMVRNSNNNNTIYYNTNKSFFLQNLCKFIHSIKSQITRENYLKNLKYYMKFLGVKTLRELVDTKNKPQKIMQRLHHILLVRYCHGQIGKSS